jgi:hypothetical protein
MFNAVVDWCDTTHRHRLHRLPEAAAKFEMFNQKILHKLHTRFPGRGFAANPPEAIDCALFGDGCRFKVKLKLQFVNSFFHDLYLGE